MNKVIKSFDGEYRFLSNFYEKTFEYNGVFWKTSEHAFQASKTNIGSEITCIQNAKTPGEAKKLGRRATIIHGWNDIRLDVMRDILFSKFEDEELKKLLIDTGDAILIEGNNWNDTFWGVNINTGVGTNHLGKLLMEVREHYKKIIGKIK